MDTDILKSIVNRWSPLAFSDRSISADTLEVLFEAARWAPSAFNEQPWRFVVARKEEIEIFTTFVGLLSPANREWAQHAPVLILTVACTFLAYNGKYNPTAYYDTGMAVGNLLTQATHMGLMAHQMAGFDHAQANIQLNIPDGFEPIAMMAIGYYGDRSGLSLSNREREQKERVRKPVSSFVFHGKFS